MVKDSVPPPRRSPLKERPMLPSREMPDTRSLGKTE